MIGTSCAETDTAIVLVSLPAELVAVTTKLVDDKVTVGVPEI